MVGRVWAKLSGEKMLAWGAEGECESWEHGDGRRTSGRVFCSILEPSPEPLVSSGVIDLLLYIQKRFKGFFSFYLDGVKDGLIHSFTN